jgi:hypothetical protein
MSGACRVHAGADAGEHGNGATSLQILSNQQSDTGDEASALPSCVEVVDHCRHLADKDPATFLDLPASSLNNLSNQLAAGGDQSGAMTSITEAVGTTDAWPRPILTLFYPT